MKNKFAILVPARKWILIGVALSLAGHVLVFGAYVLLGTRVREVVHRITFQPPPPPSVFIKPPTSTTRVLEFRKRPVPRGFYLQQKALAMRSRVAEVQAIAAVRTEALLSQLNAAEVAPPSLRASSRFGVGAASGTRELEPSVGVGLDLPTLSTIEVKGIKETRQQVDMKLDMLSVENMDTGEYRAMVIQDPTDRKKIKGYIHLAHVFTRSRGARIEVDYGQDLAQQVTTYQSFDYLIKALHEYTGIRADYIGPVPLDSPELLNVPWVLLPEWIDEAHALNDRELVNLGKYLVSGGFAVWKKPGGQATAERDFKSVSVFRRALATQGLNEGAHWHTVYLEPGHPIYHAFFDFDMSVQENTFYTSLGFRSGDMGLVIGDRLCVFAPSSRKQVVTETASLGVETMYVAHDATRSLQFAVNIIVFALTQEGSMTQQLMAGIR